jgi:hypothetical protein
MLMKKQLSGMQCDFKLPIMRVSAGNAKTFDPTLSLATMSTIGECNWQYIP